MSLTRRAFLAAILSVPVCTLPWLSESWFSEIGDIAAAVSLTIWLVLVGTGLGADVRSWALSSRTESRLMQLTMNLTVGWAVLTCVLLGLASIKLLRPVVLLPLGLAIAVVWGIGAGHRPSGLDLWMAIPWRRYVRVLCRGALHKFSAIAMFAVVLTTGCWAVAPVFDWDAEMYHLPLAEHFVEHAGITTHPDVELLNYPGQMHLWYSVGLACGTDRLPALLMLLSAATLSVMAAEFAGKRIGLRTGIWTLFVFWCGPIVTLVAATPRVDPACGLFLFAAFVWIAPVLFDRQPIDYRAAITAGVLFGMAAGIKFIGLVGWATLGFWCVVSCLSCSRLRTARMARTGFMLVVTALCVTAPWWGRNWIVWHNPLYPKFAATVVESASTTTSSGTTTTHAAPPVLRRTLDIFSDPSRTNGPPYQFPHYVFLSVLVLPLLPVKRIIIVIAGVATTYWCLTLALTAMQRHLFPAFPLLSMLVGYVLAWAETRRSPVRFAPAVVASLMLLVLLLPNRLFYTPALMSYLTGQSSERQFLIAVSPTLNHATEWLDANSRQDKTILMCWEARTFRVQQPCIADPAWRNWSDLAHRAGENLATAKQWLDQKEIGYVLINMAALRYHVNVDRTHTQEQLRRVEQQRVVLEETLLQRVYESEAVTIYKIRD